MTETQIKKILKEHTYICIDTREKSNKHITDALDKYGIRWKSKTHNYGDYSIEVEPCELVPEGYVPNLVIERKGSLDEILTNLTTYQQRFFREFDRCMKDNYNMIVVIETKRGSYCDLVECDFKNKLTGKQALGLIHSIYTKNKIPFGFVTKDKAALMIYSFLKYELKNYLKNLNNK